MSGSWLIVCFLCGWCWAQTTVDLPRRSIGLLEALQSTLDKHPGIQLQERQVEFQEGALAIASGEFDTVLNASIQHDRVNTPLTRAQQANFLQAGITTSDLAANTTSYSLNSQSRFRNGITAGPILSLNRNTDNLASRLGLNQSRLLYGVVLPLLRGRGREVVTAQERSTRSTLDATLFDLNHTVAQLLANTAIQYWNALGAARNLEIARSAEERGRNYVRDVQVLIDADRVPRGEINQLFANLAGRTASRIAAEQNVIAAQQNLAVAMGLGPAEMAVLIEPADALPDWTQDSVPAMPPPTVEKFLDETMLRRADLLASNQRVEAAQMLLPAARNQLLPQLDLNLSAGYAGLLEGTNFARSFGSPFVNVKGPDATAGMTYSFPPRNSTARGILAETEASYRQAQLRQSDLARNIASAVVTAMSSLVTNVARLKQAREAVRTYRLALNGEQEKFRLGLGSLVDVLTIEDRLTGALSQELAAQVDYAVDIETLRYATGTIVDPDQRTHVLDRNTFLSLPFDWGQP